MDDYILNNVSLCSSVMFEVLHPSELAELHLCIGWNCHYSGVNRCWMLLCGLEEKGLESEKSSYLYIEAFPFISTSFILARHHKDLFSFLVHCNANAILY